MKKPLSFSLILFFILYMYYSKYFVLAVYNSIIICIKIVIPTFFIPLLIIEIFLSYNLYKSPVSYLCRVLKPLMSVNESEVFVIMVGILCGYPSGVKTATSLLNKNKISLYQYKKIIKICNNPSPAFVIVIFYPIINQLGFTLIQVLFFTYGASLIITFLLFSKKINRLNHNIKPAFLCQASSVRKQATATFSDIFISVGNTLYVICTNIVIFSTFSSLLKSIFAPNKVLSMCSLFIEITSNITSIHPNDYFDGLILTIFLMFGGLSVCFQTFCIMNKPDLILEYIKGRILVCVSSALIYSCIFIINKTPF